MMLNIPNNDEQNALRQAEQEVRIEALAHLIDADFDSPMSCHAVCLLLSQLFQDSDDRIDKLVASLATKALNSTVELAGQEPFKQ